ncbi:MAG: ribonuclease III family protein [Candidatus Hermodarchaeota archaeon]
MHQFKDNLNIITKKNSNQQNLMAFIQDKGNAKLGDSLVNFIYSIAKTIVLGKPTGMKVSDSILSEAYKTSLWYKNNLLRVSGKKSRIADSVEALILFFWIEKDSNLEILIEPLISQLDPTQLQHPREEHISAVNSFRNLLDYLFQIYSNSF